MPLPVGHPYQDGAPTIEDDTILYLDQGASNGPVGSVVNSVFQPHNTYRSLIYKHNDTVVGFADPPNNQSVTTYPSLDEAGTQNRNTFLIEMLRETTRKKVCVITAGQSTIGITNQINGFNSPSVVTQTTNLCTAARAKLGKTIKFALVNVTDGDAKFGTDPTTLGGVFTSYCANLRAATGNPSLPIIMVGLGAKPPIPDGEDDPYPSWVAHREYFKNTYSADNFYYVQTDDLDRDTYTEEGTHWNGLGHKYIAGRILHTLKHIGIVPYEKTINVHLAGQSNAGNLGYSVESNSSAGIEAVGDVIQSYFPKYAYQWYKGTEGGSAYVETTDAVEYWWDIANDVRGVELQQFLDGLNSDNKRSDFIYWDLGITEANVVDTEGEVTKAQVKATALKIFNEFWRINPSAKIILRIPHRRTSFANTGGFQTIRDIFFELIDEYDNIYRGADTYDLELYDTVHNTDAATLIEAERLGRIISHIRGANVSQSVYGAYISNVSRSGTTVTVTITHDKGSDFTPTSAIEGFVFHDDGVAIAINSAVRTDANTITLTLDSEPSGIETLYYGYDAMVGLDISKVVKDNSNESMPLQTDKIVL